MNRISASELRKEFGRYRKEAQSNPVVITHRGHDDVVLLSIKEFIRLKSLDRQILYTHELPEKVIEEFLTVSIPEEASKFDGECDHE